MITIFANNAKTTLSNALTSTSTSLTVSPGTGSLFPIPVGAQYFVLTLTDAATGLINEIVWVTAASGDTFTIVRGKEGTSAKPWLVGDFTNCFPTAGTQSIFVQPDQYQNGLYEYSIAAGTANALTASVASNLTSPPDGMPLIVKALSANTGATTLQLTLGSTILSALSIVKGGNQTLVAGDIAAVGYPIQLNWSSVFNAWVQQNPATGISTIPVGSIFKFPCTTAPTGFLIANGQLLSRSLYPNLYSFAAGSGNIVSDSAWTAGAYGAFSSGDGSTTFRLPQLGGYFLRSLDNGNGIDPSRTLGTVQSSQNLTHNHTASVSITDPGHSHTAGVNDPGHVHTTYPTGPNGGSGGYTLNGFQTTPQTTVSAVTNISVTNYPNSTGISSAAAIANSGGGESRPINIAVLTCIKY